MHTKDIGDIAEQFVIAHCLKRGWSVSKPIGDNQLYDIILDKGDGHLYKVQIKNGKYQDNGTIYIECKSCGYTFDGNGERKLFAHKYSIEDVHYIASYCSHTNECYLIENTGQSTITLRIEVPCNKKILKRSRYTKDYLI